MERNGIVYRLTFPGGKVYIGITREGLESRIRRHIAYARSGKPLALSAAIRKYGENSFQAEVIGFGSLPELKSLERLYISQHDALGAGGYNMTGGGDGMFRTAVPLEIRSKISSALAGRKLTPEHCRRVSEAQRGKVIPAEARAKMSEAAKRRCRDPMSEEQREKIRLALLGKKRGKYKPRREAGD